MILKELLGNVYFNDDDGTFIVPYLHLYTLLPKYVFFLLAGFLMLGLFYMLYAIADRHLTWSLEHLSKYCRLSPHLAGLTFLAFGNGAPDFFTAVFGASEEPELILGSSVGSGLFITTVVFGAVIILAKNQNTEASEFSKIDAETGKRIPLVLPHIDGPAPTLSLSSKAWLEQPKVASLPFVRSLVLYLVCVGSLTLFALRREVPMWQPALLVVLYIVYMALVVGQHYYAERKLRKKLQRANSSDKSAGNSVEMEAASVKEALELFSDLSFLSKLRQSLYLACWQHDSKRLGIFWLDVLRFIFKLPFELVLNFTILPMEDPSDTAQTPDHLVAQRFLHRIRALICPSLSVLLCFGLFVPIDHIGLTLWFGIWCGVAISLTIGTYFTTSFDRPPKCFLLHVFMAFIMCIIWIYAVSSELVSCLSTTGRLAGISTTIIGILVLAWGNSFGDLVADVALSKNGAAETAISAVFGGPIQNVLLTIGTSFILAAAKSPNRILRISALKPDIFIALGTLTFVILLCLFAVSIVGRFRVPRSLGFVLLGIYAVYFTVAVLFGIKVSS